APAPRPAQHAPARKAERAGDAKETRPRAVAGAKPAARPESRAEPFGYDGAAPSSRDTAGSGGLEQLDSAVEGVPASDLETAAAPRRAARVAKKTMRANPWDSPLMLVGGFSLLILIAVSIVMYFSLTRGTATEYFEAAQVDYRGGSYANAIAKYEKFLRYYPSDPNASEARVRMGMADLRTQAEGARDPKIGLEAAERILPTIEGEEAFADARSELATLLPDIARAFAERAKTTKKIDEAESLLDDVDRAMKLVDNPSYIPTSAKKTQVNVIEKIQETVTQVRRDMNQERELATAEKAMDDAIHAGNTREAFRVRDALVASYPGLEYHPNVVRKITEIADRERDLVTVSTAESAAAPPVANGGRTRVVLYGRSAKGLSGVDEETVVLSVPGAVYGLDAASGKVLWRTFVGYDVAFDPWRVSADADADAIVVDGATHAVMRVNARTGETVWRLVVGEPFANPVIWRDRVLIAARSGNVWNIDVASGSSRRRTELKQPLDAPPGAHDKFPLLYQVGENDNLYVVSIDTMECREVFYLGQRKGTVVAPPTFAAGLMFVPINVGSDFAFVHILAVDANGFNVKPIQNPIRVDGHVLTKPLVAGRRIVFVTSLGATVALEVNPQQDPPVAQEIAPLPVARNTPLTTHAVLDQASIWLADQRLLAYDIQASQGQFNRRWAAHDGEPFVAPLKRVGEAVAHVRGSAQSNGFHVTAVDGATGKTIYWQTDLSFPTLDVVAGPSGGLLAVSSLGAVYSITPESLAAGFIEGASDLRLGATKFHANLTVPDGRQIIFSTSGQALVYDPAKADREMRLLRLNMPESSAAARPILAAGGLVVPIRTGQISAFDLSSGSDLVLPFQPPARGGAAWNWSEPAAIGTDGKEFVIADDRQTLYRMGIVDTGGAHLAPLDQVQTSEPIRGPLAVLDNTVFATVARNDGDVLVSFALPRLKEGVPVPLQGRVQWGPRRAGDSVLIATDTEGLSAWNAAGERKWTSPTPAGGLAGSPAIVGGDYLFASQSGVVWRVAAADGKEIARREIGEPLGGGPVVTGNAVLVPGADGTLIQIPLLEP
ncbi:MAG: hypothetical protein FJ297_18880, partial [Planctomycetes bacterium]|nr:hypothetical protein [Planctomycetota bacterium]